MYLIFAASFLAIFIIQYKKEIEIEELFSRGVTEKVRIIYKTDNCLSSTRNRNRIKVENNKQVVFSIPITYDDCLKLKINDSVLIRYLDGYDSAIRVFDYNTPHRYKDYFHYIFLAISVVSIIVFIFKILR